MAKNGNCTSGHLLFYGGLHFYGVFFFALVFRAMAEVI